MLLKKTSVTPFSFRLFCVCLCLQHEMLDQIVLYHMRAVHREPLVAVRTAVTQHLVSLAQQCSDVQHFEKIVYIIYKVSASLGPTRWE